MRYGITDEQWKSAKEEIRKILISRAKLRGMIPYSELADKLETVRLTPDSHALHEMLGEISVEEDAAGRGMLSVIVVHKYGDMQPGPGFFRLAKSLGRDTSDLLRCWVDEVKHVHAVWSLK
ncbi:MAG: RNA polymerase sigma factor region1.1 domain-containing protein [Alicyclobacillus sp.]|nr:RNA polymerase sigma factor region1.1 domain-containing protein [Alicyclobacillus sp.]